jgi:hypothetical protein
MIRVDHPGSGSRILFFLPIPDPGVKKAPDPGSAILVRTYGNMDMSSGSEAESLLYIGSNTSPTQILDLDAIRIQNLRMSHFCKNQY